MPGAVKTRAIVLNALTYGESDLIVTLLSEDEGVIKIFAKGAARSRKRFAGCFEPFTLISAGLRIKDDGLSKIDSADIIKAHYGIRESLERITAGAVMLEAAATLEPGPHAGAFSLLEDTLGLLEKSADPHGLTIIFLVKMLALSGLDISHSTEAKSLTHGALAFIRQAEAIEPEKMPRLKMAKAGRAELIEFLSAYFRNVAGKKLKALESIQ